jgi:NitT/TauT family transport system substrate-binding protein
MVGRRVVVLLAVAAVSIACAAPIAPPAAAPAAAVPAILPTAAATAPAALAPLSPPVAVRMGVVASVSDSGIFIAQEKGYFQEQGLAIESIPFDSAAGMTAPLSTDQLDVGAGSPGAGLYNALARDLDLKIVADKGSNRPGFGYVALIARPDLVASGQVQDYPDLRGRTIALNSRATGAEIQLDRALARGNLTTDDVELAVMPFPDMGLALANRSIDLAVSLEPLITAGVEQGLFVRWKGVDEFYPNDQSGVVLYAPRFAREQAEAARRWMIAYLKGVRDYNDAFTKQQGQEEVVGIINRSTTVKDPALVRKMVPAGINPDGRVSVEDLLFKQQWYLSHGAMAQPADVGRAVDHQFVDYAVERLGPYHTDPTASGSGGLRAAGDVSWWTRAAAIR